DLIRCLLLFRIIYFFFQAEDGIRDGHVTGVQTCALPISSYSGRLIPEYEVTSIHHRSAGQCIRYPAWQSRQFAATPRSAAQHLKNRKSVAEGERRKFQCLLTYMEVHTSRIVKTRFVHVLT